MKRGADGGQARRALELARERGIVSRSDLDRESLPGECLSRLAREGLLTRLAPGVYMDAEADLDEHLELAVIAKRAPRAVFFGLTALVFHELTTQVARRVEFAIERGTWAPALDWPAARVVRLSGASYSTGIERHGVGGGVRVRVYSVAKTVADLFKFRSRYGLDVAIEALKEGWSARRFTMGELGRCAAACRVLGVMRPYMEMLS